jgi:hypothetical protein
MTEKLPAYNPIANQGPAISMTDMEKVIVEGNLEALSPGVRVQYYMAVCNSMKLNHLTKPFDYIRLNGKITLYCTRNATDQLRRRDGVSTRIIGREMEEDGIYVVTIQAQNREGRQDEDVGIVNLAGVRGQKLAIEKMKATTKAKRRVTLSICGLGWLDDVSLEDVRDKEELGIPEEELFPTEHFPQDEVQKIEEEPAEGFSLTMLNEEIVELDNEGEFIQEYETNMKDLAAPSEGGPTGAERRTLLKQFDTLNLPMLQKINPKERKRLKEARIKLNKKLSVEDKSDG